MTTEVIAKPRQHRGLGHPRRVYGFAIASIGYLRHNYAEGPEVYRSVLTFSSLQSRKRLGNAAGFGVSREYPPAFRPLA